MLGPLWPALPPTLSTAKVSTVYGDIVTGLVFIGVLPQGHHKVTARSNQLNMYQNSLFFDKIMFTWDAYMVETCILDGRPQHKITPMRS